MKGALQQLTRTVSTVYSAVRYVLLLEDVHALGDMTIVGRLFLVMSSWLGWLLHKLKRRMRKRWNGDGISIHVDMIRTAKHTTTTLMMHDGPTNERRKEDDA